MLILTILYIYVCLICKALLNLYCFASVLLLQHRSMRLHHNLLICDFQLDFSHVLHMRGTTQVKNQSIPLILPTGSAYFVEKSNIHCESCILIGWANKKVTIGSAMIKVQVQPKPIKAGFWHQKFHSEPSFWSVNNCCHSIRQSIQSGANYVCIYSAFSPLWLSKTLKSSTLLMMMMKKIGQRWGQLMSQMWRDMLTK